MIFSRMTLLTRNHDWVMLCLMNTTAAAPKSFLMTIEESWIDEATLLEVPGLRRSSEARPSGYGSIAGFQSERAARVRAAGRGHTVEKIPGGLIIRTEPGCGLAIGGLLLVQKITLIPPV